MYYNGTMMNVISPTTKLTFTAPSLPDNVFTGTVVIMVTATSIYGIGPASERETAVIYGKNNIKNFYDVHNKRVSQFESRESA